MWYTELIICIALLVIFSQTITFVDLASDEQQVNNEALVLVGTLLNVQERSRNYHYMKKSDFRPLCNIYTDKYEIRLTQGGEPIKYYLPDDIRLDFYDTATLFTFRQLSLYNGWPTKTIKIYKGNIAKYIIINRVGRIRIAKFYEEPS